MTCGDNGGISRRSGAPCKRIPASGHTRCAKHGGLLPEARIKAENALALVRLPAIEALHDILAQSEEPTCATCGYPTHDTEEKRVVLAAAKIVLDRTGFGPRATVELTRQSDGALDLSHLTTEERGELLGLLAQVQEVKERVRVRMGAALTSPATM